METIVSEIAKHRMEKEVNYALSSLGLFVTDIRFDSTADLRVIIELGASEALAAAISQ